MKGSLANMAKALRIMSIIRPMKGGSRSYLVKSEDDHYYVAKFRNNPQGNRTLANEWMASKLLHRLGASTPVIRSLYLSAELQRDADLCFCLPTKRVPVPVGLHLGSQCPIDPQQQVVFDFIPFHMYKKVENLQDVALSLVFDRWVGQLDARQLIFYRSPKNGTTAPLQLSLIDHGYCFGADEWNPNLAAPLHGVCSNRQLYSLISESDIEAAVYRVQRLSSTDIEDAISTVPKDLLLPSDEQALSGLLSKLQWRHSRLDELVHTSLKGMADEYGIRPIVTFAASSL
jgi:hypothetical protein